LDIERCDEIDWIDVAVDAYMKVSHVKVVWVDSVKNQSNACKESDLKIIFLDLFIEYY
jgi:hypothetical protein